MIGCDGIFDRLTNREIVDTVWRTIRFNQGRPTPQPREVLLNECVNNLLRRAMLAESQDNLSVVLVFFKRVF